MSKTDYRRTTKEPIPREHIFLTGQTLIRKEVILPTSKLIRDQEVILMSSLDTAMGIKDCFMIEPGKVPQQDSFHQSFKRELAILLWLGCNQPGLRQMS